MLSSLAGGAAQASHAIQKTPTTAITASHSLLESGIHDQSANAGIATASNSAANLSGPLLFIFIPMQSPPPDPSLIP